MLVKLLFSFLFSLIFCSRVLFAEEFFEDRCTCYNPFPESYFHEEHMLCYLSTHFPGATKHNTRNDARHVINLVRNHYHCKYNALYKPNLSWGEASFFNEFVGLYPNVSWIIADHIATSEKEQIIKKHQQLREMHEHLTGSHLRYYADFRRMFDYLHQCAGLKYQSELARTQAYFAQPYYQNKDKKNDINKALANLDLSHKRYLSDIQIDCGAIEEAFEKLHEECKKKHDCLRTYYEDGLLKLAQGKNSEAMQASNELIEVSKKHNNQKYLHAGTYFELGIFLSLAGEYSQAIEALNHAIEQDPKNKNAYIERAACYFEMGDIDLAIRDYLQSGIDKQLVAPTEHSKIEFAKGFAKGARKGLVQGGKDFPVAIYQSVCGAGHLLWTIAKDPIQTPTMIIEASTKFIEFLQKEDLETISHLLVPELHDLVKKWPSLCSRKRGKKLGFILGKYGINIIPQGAIAKAFKVCQDLRRANIACNLKAAALGTQNKLKMVSDAKFAFIKREQFLRESSQLKSIKASIASGKVEGLAVGKLSEKGAENLAIRLEIYYSSVRLHHDSQGKHLLGHQHYKNLPENLKSTYAIWHHPDPEGILKKTAGKGKIIRGKRGEVGCQELVDCGEIIGIHIKKHPKEYKEICRAPTTMAVIHYRKDGYAHLSPAEPIGGHIK
jgi:tetratricopeptide (TPR) repeat protein